MSIDTNSESELTPKLGVDPIEKDRAWYHLRYGGRHPWLEIKMVEGKGRGVFAKGYIPIDCVIEKFPVFRLTPGITFDDLKKVGLYGITFAWGWGATEKTTVHTIALGYGTLYNHSFDPNAYLVRASYDKTESYDPYYKYGEVEVRSLKDISPGEEILIEYLPFDQREELTFTPIDHITEEEAAKRAKEKREFYSNFSLNDKPDKQSEA